MKLVKFLKILSILLELIAGIYFCIGVLRMTAPVIEKLSSAKMDYNVDILNSYCSQKSDFIVGLVVLVCALVLQLVCEVSSIWLVNVSKSLSKSILYLAGIVVITVFISCRIKQSIYENTRLSTGKHMLSNIVNSELVLENVGYIEKVAKNLIGFERSPNEDDKAFKERLLKEVKSNEKW